MAAVLVLYDDHVRVWAWGLPVFDHCMSLRAERRIVALGPSWVEDLEEDCGSHPAWLEQRYTAGLQVLMLAGVQREMMGNGLGSEAGQGAWDTEG